ncbi:MAG: polyphosphate polymerase domain-containing protein [Mogibacterium sp.]|nr:polyphosphate polymerase domain-containing protein [Mogibacterium sp.]
MGYQAVFKRYEIKYMVTAEQKDRILKAMEPYMEMDRFGRSTVRNIYFDTDDFVLARHSIAKPDFKEKLRVRCYSRADADSTVFVELKRKFDGVVYKRRVGLREADAMKWMAGSNDPAIKSSLDAESPQVTSEIEYFKGLYRGIKPVLYLSYDREAYRMRKDACTADGGTDFRVTFDSNIRCRESNLTLRSESYGTGMLEDGMFLMELKCPGAIPLWMTEVLSEEHIYKTSFSKYGTAYCRFMEETPEERAHMIAAAGYERPGTVRSAVQAGAFSGRLTGARAAGKTGRRHRRAASFGRVSA